MKIDYRSKNFWFSAVICLLSLVNCIVYATADARENAPVIIVMLALVAACELVLALKPLPYLPYLPLIFMCVAVGCFIPLAFDEIGDILSKINMTGLSASWIISAVLLVVNIVLTAVASVFDAK